MDTFSQIEPLRDSISQHKQAGNTIGFVPTMGALHEGHLSLIQKARQKADKVVVSIYVNPEQFGPDEDFEDYPRSLDEDLKQCREMGVDLVFTPSNKIMYPSKQFLSIQLEQLNSYMDGASRPGFYEGILLVVNKLFNIIEPDIAVFGQKDIQQYRILQQMVAEFNHGVELVMAPIIRANDGLALSSRNNYLNDEQRAEAPGLYRSLLYVKQQIDQGIAKPSLLLDHQKNELEEKGFKIDYLNVFSFEEIKPVHKLQQGKNYILAGAVYLGDTRLIDNFIIER